MKIARLRWTIQITVSFILLFGVYIGVYLGNFLPTFSCFYVCPRGGTCFLFTLQHFLGALIRGSTIPFMASLLYFSMLMILTGRAWCGWICPLGLFQDILDWVRRKLGIGGIRFTSALRKCLNPIKWIFLFIAILIPVWVAYPLAYPSVALDLDMPFCQLCPGKYILPLLVGDTQRIAINFENATTITMSILGLFFSITVILGAMVKRRFWCPYCPLGLLMSWYRKISFFKLKKDDLACTRCGICADVCPVEIEDVFRSRNKKDVTFADCTLCLKCVENCPEDNALQAVYLGKTFFRSTYKGFFSR
ncbi:4Fe-4S binding protein [Desulfobacca acetoxidans]